MGNKRFRELNNRVLDSQGFVQVRGRLTKADGKRKAIFKFDAQKDHEYQFDTYAIQPGENIKLSVKNSDGKVLIRGRDSIGSKNPYFTYTFDSSGPVKITASIQKDKSNKGAIPFNLSLTDVNVQSSAAFKKRINDGKLTDEELLDISKYSFAGYDHTANTVNSVSILWNSMKGDITLDDLDDLLMATVFDDGTVSVDEIQVLESIHQKLPDRVDPAKLDYYSYVFGSAIGDSPANSIWTGGVDNRSKRLSLGNLEEGSGTRHVTLLSKKWFKGEDLPLAYIDGDTANKTPPSTFTYAEASGDLFDGEPTYKQLAQGNAGTCWFLAALNAIANSKNEKKHIKEMFVDNGDGTFGVQFHAPNGSGETAWVTVNRQLPVQGYLNTSLKMTGSYTSPAWFDDGYRYRRVKPRIDLPDYGEANLLWAALAEKALAQVNETGLLRRASWENSYAAIEGGWSKGIDFVTGEVASDSFHRFFGYDYDEFTTVDPKVDPLLLISFAKWTGSNNLNLVSGHAYTVIDYDRASDTFLVANPWGESASGYDATFTLSGSVAERLYDRGAIGFTKVI